MHFDLAPLNLVIRAAVVYFSILILLRISGKRQVGQMGASEFVAVLLISNAVQNSMNGGDNSLVGGILLATVIVSLSMIISYFSFRSEAVSKFFEGTPRLLIHDGKFIEENLAKERMSHAELKSLLRKQGIHAMSEVKTAVLEAEGVLSIFRHTEAHTVPSDLIPDAPRSPDTTDV